MDEMTLTLKKKWLERLKLVAKGDKLREKGNKIYPEGNVFQAEGHKLRAEAYELFAKDSGIRAKAEGIWVDAVLKAFGSIKMKWVPRDGKIDCHLGNGEVYKWDMKEGK
jgi:hypothetical protein